MGKTFQEGEKLDDDGLVALELDGLETQQLSVRYSNVRSLQRDKLQCIEDVLQRNQRTELNGFN